MNKQEELTDLEIIAEVNEIQEIWLERASLISEKQFEEADIRFTLACKKAAELLKKLKSQDHQTYKRFLKFHQVLSMLLSKETITEKDALDAKRKVQEIWNILFLNKNKLERDFNQIEQDRIIAVSNHHA